MSSHLSQDPLAGRTKGRRVCSDRWRHSFHGSLSSRGQNAAGVLGVAEEVLRSRETGANSDVL